MEAMPALGSYVLGERDAEDVSVMNGDSCATE